MFPLIRPTERPERSLLRRPVNPFGLLSDEVDSLLERFMNRWALPEGWLPAHRAWTVEEAEKEVVYRLEVPGFEAAEIALTVVGSEMTVRAEHRAPEEPAAETKEKPEPRRFASFELTVTLPTGLDTENVSALYRNGILEVHVPRSPGFVPRRIEVGT